MVFDKIYEIIYFQKDRFPSSNSFNQKILGRWESRSTDQFINQVRQLCCGLLDCKEGSKIGIYASHGSTDWMVIDFACQHLGLVTVPINPNYTNTELKYILDEAELVLCFVNEDLLANELVQNGFDKAKLISYGNSIRYKSWSDLSHICDDQFGKKIDKRSALINDTDLATIIYTSGSTGFPKGVMLSHRNIVSNIKSIISLIPVSYRHKVASFLPLSHIFERTVIYTYVAVGARIHFIQDPRNIIKATQDIKPDYISSVPRILEKIHNEISVRIKKRNGFVRRIVRAALNIGEKPSTGFLDKISTAITVRLADLFVYRRWRKVLGGNVKGIMVGAASMQPHIARLYTRAGIPIKEGYGLTETSPVVSFNRFEPGGTKFGTVGIPIPGVEVKIVNPDKDGAGEICVKGPNVMLGYFKNEELTRERIDKDGWFSTGDIGYFSNKRFLTISGRKKNIFKTSSGQYVYPQKIEEAARIQDAIDQIMIIGFQKPYVSALIVPDFTFLKAWCKSQGIHWTAELYMIENDRVKSYYKVIIDEVNKLLKRHERIQSFSLLAEEWSIATGEYTPTLKLKRNQIIKKYGKYVSKMYLPK